MSVSTSSTEFLQPDTEQIRHTIRGVLESYSHEWDILSELLQNSVDAIREKEAGKGHISLTVNATTKTIKVVDNGVGIDPSQMHRLLRPFGTNKANKPKQIGEKGVGLKFVMFSSSRIAISTNGACGGCTATVVDAAVWLRTQANSPLLLSISSDDSLSMGTCVEVIIDDDEHPIFKYSFRELIFLLRSKTAVGDVGFIWDTPLDADVKLVHFDQGGRRNEVEFECRYLLPTECANKNEYISISEFEDWLKDSDRSDTEKRRKLLNKIVYVVEKKFQSGREIRYWSCFVPRREFWRSLSKNFGIEYMDADDDTPVEEPIGVGFSGGYVTSTKGMPTGISIEMKPRGSGGYLANFYMVVDDPLLRFDIGRKSIQGRQAAMLREIAYEKFREFINKTRRYMGGAVDPQILGWDRDEVFEEIEQLPALGSKVSRFSKRPNSQEATVAAMFFEQIGRGQMTDIIPLISGYKGRYDLYAKWKGRRVVIEFKFDLTGLFRDFTDERKMFDEINAVVVWEVTENDRAIAARRAMTLEVVEPSSLTIKQTFPGATKTLNMGDVNPIHVVELRYMLSC